MLHAYLSLVFVRTLDIAGERGSILAMVREWRRKSFVYAYVRVHVSTPYHSTIREFFSRMIAGGVGSILVLARE